MKEFNFFTNFIRVSQKQEIYAHRLQTHIPTIISKGQWTPTIIRERSMSISHGINQ